MISRVAAAFVPTEHAMPQTTILDRRRDVPLNDLRK
jgi:hypothetical protein